MTAYRIARDDLSGETVRELLTLHIAEMQDCSPACKVHAMPAERLRQPDVTFYAAWDGDALAAVGAIRALGADRGELKSMRAAPAYRGRGAGRAMLDHLLADAKARGWHWLGLETGRAPPFADAIALYRRNGFVECAGFDEYVSDDFTLCMMRPIDQAG